MLLLSSACFSQEICNNGIDDDGDGKIDLNDPDCLCNSTPVPSIIPNASFENYTECPSQFSQLNYATNWVQATEATTDYLNTCGLILNGVNDMSNILMPFPSGNGIVGAIFSPNWNEYLGSCLTSPMLANTNYQLTFSIASLPIEDYGGSCNGGNIYYEPVNITIYGTQDCVNLPLATTIAPTLVSNEWVVLGSALYTPQSNWGQLTISFTPATNINAIMMGAPENLPPLYYGSDCLPYFLFDDLVLNESSLFGLNISQTGTFCGNDLILRANPSIPVSSAATYQWYKGGIAIPGATLSTYPVASTPGNLAQFSVKIIDGENCFVAPRYTINASTPAPQLTALQPNCFTQTGTITVTTLSDFYSFDNGVTWGTNPVSEPLVPGRYYIKTKTTTGCVSIANAVNLTDSSIVNYIDYTYDNPGCATNGSITITSLGSQFSFDGGLTWSSNNTASLPFGNYNIKLKDATGCVTGENYAYLQEFYLDYPSVTSVQPTCATPGSITVNTPAESYSFDDGATWVNTPTLNNLTPGVYLIKIKNAQGCTSSSYYEYLYEQYIDGPQVDIAQITCATPGSISITTPAAEYSFDGGITWGTNPVKSITTEGYYEVIIKNSVGCRSYPYGFYIYEDLVAAPEITTVQPSCGTAGSITVTTPAAEYSFDGGYTWTTNAVLSNLNDYQYYEVKIKNNNGCLSYGNYAGIYPSYDTPQAPYADVIQPGSCTAPLGTITITSSASLYSFDNGVTWTSNNIATQLAPGEYKLKAKGFSDCESPVTLVTINIPLAPPVAPATVIVNPTCTVATGTISITDVTPFYSYDNGRNWETNNSASLLPGTYLVKTKNAAGCESPATTATIQDTGAPGLPNYSVVQPNCFSIGGTITTTTIAEAYSFDNGATWGISNISSPLLPGVYFIKIKNATGCESDSVRIVITPDIVPLPRVRNLTYCKDLRAVPLTATGTDLLWYSTDVGGTGISIAPTPSTAATGITIWYLTQTINGCESERAAMSVTVLDNLPPPVVPDTFMYCQDEPTVSLYAEGINLLWYTTEDGGTGNPVAPLPASNVAGTFNYFVSQSGERCESNRAKITVIIKPTPEGPETETNVVYKHHNPTVQLTARGDKLTWYNSSMEELYTAPTPSSENIGSKVYYVKQTIDDCEGKPVKIVVTIIPNYITIAYPLYFSPNGDGINETWNIYTPPFNITATVFIYDRYGKFIAQLTAPGKGWDGTSNGSMLPATDYWFSVFYTEYGVGKEYKSHFSLIR